MDVVTEIVIAALFLSLRTEVFGSAVFNIIILLDYVGKISCQICGIHSKSNKIRHRYAGLLTCGDCGITFVPRIRTWNGNRRVEYLCKNYMHHGKEFCPSHRIRESELDVRVQQYTEELRSQRTAEQVDLRRIQRLWEMKRPTINAHIAELYSEIQRLEQEIDDLLLEKIQSGS